MLRRRGRWLPSVLRYWTKLGHVLHTYPTPGNLHTLRPYFTLPPRKPPSLPANYLVRLPGLPRSVTNLGRERHVGINPQQLTEMVAATNGPEVRIACVFTCGQELQAADNQGVRVGGGKKGGDRHPVVGGLERMYVGMAAPVYSVYTVYTVYTGGRWRLYTGPVCPHLRAALQPCAAEPAPNALLIVLDAYMAPADIRL
eukprot:354119-Chlamydomonas_euryale.AAC.1